jgi:hypothetical protein
MDISISEEKLREYLQLFWPSLKHFASGYEPIIFVDHPSIPEYFMYICPLCLGNYMLFLKEGFVISSEFDMDHFPPQNVGGTLKALVCKACNSRAGHEYDYANADRISK